MAPCLGGGAGGREQQLAQRAVEMEGIEFLLDPVDGVSFCWRIGQSEGSDEEPWTREANQ